MSDRWGAKTPAKKCHQRKSRRKKNNAQKSQYNKGTDQQASTSRGNDSKTEEEFEDDSDIEDDSEDEEDEVEELNYVCPILICNEKFHGYDDLMEHVQENHPRRRRKSRKPRDETNLTPHQIKMRRKRDIYTNIKHNPNNLNLEAEDQVVFCSYQNGETMIKKKGQKTLILKSPMATQTPAVASRTSDISHKDKDHSPKKEPQSMKAVVSSLIVAGVVGVTAVTVPTLPLSVLLAPLLIPLGVLHYENKKIEAKPISSIPQKNDSSDRSRVPRVVNPNPPELELDSSDRLSDQRRKSGF